MGALSALPALALPLPPGMVGPCAELSGLKPASLPLHIATRHICSDPACGSLSPHQNPPLSSREPYLKVFPQTWLLSHLSPGGGTPVVTSWSVSLEKPGVQPWPLLQPRGGNHVVFLELRRHSRVTTGISAFPLGWPWEAQSSPRVARESWGLPPVKSGVNAHGEGERVIALESW